MQGTSLATPPGSKSSLSVEFSMVAATGPHTSTSWSDLPADILLSILQLLELPQALAFASVCTTWRSAAADSGIPCSGMPWLISWAGLLEDRGASGRCTSAVTCNFYSLTDVNKVYDVSFPQGCFVACCGASRGWLVLVNELSNLVLYNLFSLVMIPLPPVTDFTCVEAVYDSKGRLEHYLFETKGVHSANYLGTWFYQKAVLSCSPSKGGDYIVMIIHRDSTWLSFVKAGQSRWQVASTLGVSGTDRYMDCAYHDGRFYTVTLHGMVEKWDLDELNGPTREVIVPARQPGRILTRHLLSTPRGDLLHIRAVFAGYRVRFRIRKVDLDECKEVVQKDLMDHAIFLGLNHSACLPSKSFPGLNRHCIYFTSPWMTQTYDWLCQLRRGCWGGVRVYDLKARKFELAFPFRDRKGLINPSPSEIWITLNI
ncbi:hypothetical protein ACP70R_010129 [Stipagrostis hirtigluma subsp. patula]